MITLNQNFAEINFKSATANKVSKNKPAKNSSVNEFSHFKKNIFSSVPSKDYFTKTPDKTSFRGTPWRIDYAKLDLLEKGDIGLEGAIKIFNCLRRGNYLDIGDDAIAPENKLIREKNLDFLDRLTYIPDQVDFVNYFKSETAFPNLNNVSINIIYAFLKGVEAASRVLTYKNPVYEVYGAGFDGVCSVGRRNALPGSDLDKAFVILKGGTKDDNEIVREYKGKLWKHTDQTMLSYNHDFASFPQVYTKPQVDALLDAMQEKTEKMGLRNLLKQEPSNLENLEEAPKSTTLFDKYKSLIGTYYENYVEANPFYIRLCKEFPIKHNDEIDLINPSRENIKNFGFVLETFREGEFYGKYNPDAFKDLKKYDAYHLTNLSQLNALKKRGDVKPKRIARENLQSDFEQWPSAKQFRFIKTLIRNYCSNNSNFTEEFPEYFQASEDSFAPLIKELMS